MKRTAIIVVTLAVLGLIAWAAMRNPGAQLTNAPPASTAGAQAPAATADDFPTVPRIALADAKQKIESGSVTVIDVRDVDAYLAAHIPGALQIPLARIEGEIPYLPRGMPILTYCT